MSGRRRLAAGLLLAALAPLLASLAAQKGRFAVTIETPTHLAPVSGEVEIRAVVGGDVPIERVDFLVDGVRWGEARSEPYEIKVDVGEENAEHLFQVVAFARSGETAIAEVVTPKYRVDEEFAVTLQQLYTTVTCGGERVGDLGQSAFHLEEHGQEQEIVTFGAGEIPYTAIVLLDASESMFGRKLDNARRGVRTFLDGMRRLDEGKLMVFSDRLRSTTAFSGVPELLTVGLDRIEAQGGSAVFDTLYLALRQLEPRQGRRIVVLLSDGEDVHSVLDSSVLLDTVRRSQALIYWLRLSVARDGTFQQRSFASTWRDRWQNDVETNRLEQAVLESGGRIDEVTAPEQIEPAFRAILAELGEQYAIGFYPRNLRGNGKWRPVELSVRRQGCEVRSRGGFLDL